MSSSNSSNGANRSKKSSPSMSADSTRHNIGTLHPPTATESSMIAKSVNPFVKEKSGSPGPSRSSTPRQHSNIRPRPQSRAVSTTTDIQISRNPFHNLIHHKKDDDDKHRHGMRSRAKSLLHIDKTTMAIQNNNHSKPLKRASTAASFANGGRTNTTNAISLPPRKHDNIVFNPYGVNSGPTMAIPTDQSFYLEDSDTKNLLPMPIENPNDHLPSDMKEDKVDLIDFYEIPEKSKTKVIGDGASSDVRIVNEIGDKKKKYALKKLLMFKGETPDHFYKRVVAEFVIAKNVSNGFHIVTTLELLRVATTGGIHRGWGITMELCEGGDLFSLASSPGWRLVAREEKLCIFKQIAFGIKYLHEKDIAHIDLKPENVLLTKEGIVKLTDFGISRFAHKVVGDFDSEINYITKKVGSAPYSPPEMMDLGKDKTLMVEPFKVDMWALGVLLSVLFYSKLPFNEASTKDEAYRKYLLSLTSFQNKVNPDMKTIGLGPSSDYQLAEKFHSKEASYMCWRLMHPSEKRRYTLEELFSDPYFERIATCTDELSHLKDTADELCNHDRVLELREKGFYSTNDSSAESLHKPVRSMLDISTAVNGNAPLGKPTLSRSSSTSSTSTTGSPKFSKQLSGQTPISASPVRSLLDPLPPSQLSGIRASSASLERRKSYDKNGKFTLYRTTSNSSLRSFTDGSDSPPSAAMNNGLMIQQENLPTELPPLEEDEAEKETIELNSGIETINVGVTEALEDDSKVTSSSSSTKASSEDTGGVLSEVSSLGIPLKKHVIRETLFGDTDMMPIDKDHGLVESHCLIGDDVLKKCCCFDSKIKHKHIKL